MKTLSVWASRHPILAIGLIIFGELANGFNAILLGASLFNKLPPLWLYISSLSIIGLILSVHIQATHSEASYSYWAVRRWAFIAFTGSLLLFSLLGGLWAHRVQASDATSIVLGSRRIAVVNDSLARPDTIQQPAHSTTKARLTRADNTAPPRIVYILLGIAGIAVAYVLAGLACNVLCAGYGFGALLTFYLGLGGLAGSFYYFSKAFQRSPKRRRDMTADERKRDSRRFWLSWLALIVVATVTLLISADN
ncbi:MULTISPECIES: hypothetical protein [unclassified Spirosoma]|uniref:hypothetical protein n=1 Tax=unclassified Spirosoma TaxID=2621999 RepID=UPI000960E5FA|nr:MULTISPECIES: hypothetical protein [unclassified Spirosoma]MBN8826027.1 hypothetical protein [Spirosoma sp.]OJW75481.1 MAG: hypothetical protein BGO59_08030 [Spirosoma sp. 48-14]